MYTCHTLTLLLSCRQILLHSTPHLLTMLLNAVLCLLFQLTTTRGQGQGGDGVQFHEPSGQQQQGPTAPHLSRPPLKHHGIHVNMEEERKHVESHIQEDYLDTEKMDETAILMQYFKKHDTDENHKLDGLELIKAISRMEEDHSHEEDDNHQDPSSHAPSGRNGMNIMDVMPVVDSILEQDDKDQDGYITWSEFLSRQRQKH